MSSSACSNSTRCARIGKRLDTNAHAREDSSTTAATSGTSRAVEQGKEACYRRAGGTGRHGCPSGAVCAMQEQWRRELVAEPASPGESLPAPAGRKQRFDSANPTQAKAHPKGDGAPQNAKSSSRFCSSFRSPPITFHFRAKNEPTTMKLSSTIAAAAAFLLGSANAVDFDFFDFEVGTSYSTE